MQMDPVAIVLFQINIQLSTFVFQLYRNKCTEGYD